MGGQRQNNSFQGAPGGQQSPLAGMGSFGGPESGGPGRGHPGGAGPGGAGRQNALVNALRSADQSGMASQAAQAIGSAGPAAAASGAASGPRPQMGRPSNPMPPGPSNPQMGPGATQWGSGGAPWQQAARQMGRGNRPKWMDNTPVRADPRFNPHDWDNSMLGMNTAQANHPSVIAAGRAKPKHLQKAIDQGRFQSGPNPPPEFVPGFHTA